MNSVVPLDLAEATTLYHLRTLKSSAPFLDQVQHQLEKIRVADSFFSHALGEQVRDVLARMQISDTPLLFSSDYYSYFDNNDTLLHILDDACPGSTARLVQIAIDANDEPLLQINSFFWNEMDETSRAALIIHEAVYSLLRTQRKLTHSSEVRMLVANIFSDRPVHEYASFFVLFLGVRAL